jgi:hypothetical protein
MLMKLTTHTLIATALVAVLAFGWQSITPASAPALAAHAHHDD